MKISCSSIKNEKGTTVYCLWLLLHIHGVVNLLKATAVMPHKLCLLLLPHHAQHEIMHEMSTK